MNLAEYHALEASLGSIERVVGDLDAEIAELTEQHEAKLERLKDQQRAAGRAANELRILIHLIHKGAIA